jgi:adenosine deaminase
MNEFFEVVKDLPKAELHLHIEGTLEPAMLIRLAEKHGVSLPYRNEAEVRAAYDFSDLQSFLDIYYLGAGVLIDEQDFHDLMMAYLLRCRDEGIVHAEIMFDPQTHTDRGIAFATVMDGFLSAMDEARSQWGQSSALIMSFLRHLDENSAFETLRTAEPYRAQIQSVGLDSSELGNPPEKFARVYAEARSQGYRPVAHAGEEGPPEYIWGALNTLEVERIDHGVRCLEDTELVRHLVQSQVPLTVCPLSNIRLCVFDSMSEHPLLRMLDAGLNVTVNSDDPPYFGGYLMDNFSALHEELGLNLEQAKQLARNSIQSSFLPEQDKADWLARIG